MMGVMTGSLTDRDRALFRGRNFAHLATTMPDGAPQVSPIHHIDILARKYRDRDYPNHGDRVLFRIAAPHVARMG
jgi:hypothetical protein